MSELIQDTQPISIHWMLHEEYLLNDVAELNGIDIDEYEKTVRLISNHFTRGTYKHLIELVIQVNNISTHFFLDRAVDAMFESYTELVDEILACCTIRKDDLTTISMDHVELIDEIVDEMTYIAKRREYLVTSCVHFKYTPVSTKYIERISEIREKAVNMKLTIQRT